MRKLSVLAALFLALLIGTVPAAAITWGVPDGDAHPNVGAIVVETPALGGPFVMCSGTLIHERVFLTAGHCTAHLQAAIGAGLLDIEDLSVSFNSANVLDDTTWLPIEWIETHPDYNPRRASNPYDVGLLILENPASVTPQPLPTAGFLDDLKEEGRLRQGKEGARFTVVGYGATLQWPPPQIGDPDGVRRSAESEYLKLLKAWLLTSQNQAIGDGGTCFGDSGGPVFYSDNGTETLVAITSWGDAVCVATGFNYRVDTSDTLEFINDVIVSLSNGE